MRAGHQARRQNPGGGVLPAAGYRGSHGRRAGRYHHLYHARGRREQCETCRGVGRAGADVRCSTGDARVPSGGDC